jgi:hypothetical protein
MFDEISDRVIPRRPVPTVVMTGQLLFVGVTIAIAVGL